MSSLGFIQPLLPLPHFIKSFSIPKSFQKHLEADLKGHPLQSVVLITDSYPNTHRHWVVTVEDGRFFSNGWEELCLHHCLRVGDFLVFTYHSHLLFHVIVLDPCACQRISHASPHHLKPTGSKRMRIACSKGSESKGTSESKEEYESKDKNRFVQPLLRDFIKSFSIPKSFQKHLEADLKGHPLQSVVLITDSHPNLHRHWVVTVEDGRFFSNGWEEFWLHHCLRVGDFLVFTYHSHLLFNVTVLDPCGCQRISHASPHHPEPTGSKRMRIACSKGSESEKEEEEEDEGTSAIAPERDYPSFIVRLSSYTLKKGIIFFPIGFGRENCLQYRRCQVMIVDAKLKVWPMSMNYKQDSGQVYVNKGWKPFFVANHFKPGDFLCFQLLNGGASLTFKCYRPSTLEIESHFARKTTAKGAQVEEDATTSSSEEDQIH